jgi:hypothetical protein
VANETSSYVSDTPVLDMCIGEHLHFHDQGVEIVETLDLKSVNALPARGNFTELRFCVFERNILIG